MRTSRSDANWANLIGRVARGDQSALTSLYDESSDVVHGLTIHILGDAGAAEEATLDAYMLVWQRAGLFDSSRGSASAWLLTIARNLAIDRLRASGRIRRHEESLETAIDAPAAGAGPAEASALSEQSQMVRAALDRLSPEQRETIGVAYFSGLSHGEIAARLGQPLGTVKTRIRSGMMKLREILEPLKAGSES